MFFLFALYNFRSLDFNFNSIGRKARKIMLHMIMSGILVPVISLKQISAIVSKINAKLRYFFSELPLKSGV
jgi:hypothetical protein